MLSVLTTGFTMVGIEYYYNYIIKGSLMILGIALIAVSKRKARTRKRHHEHPEPAP